MDIMYFRGAERVIICVIAGFSIWCGYSLFKLEDRHSSASSKSAVGGGFDATVGPLKVSLKKVWPGVFFAVFGMLVLAVSVITQATTQTSAGQGSVGTSNLATYDLGVSLSDPLRVRLSDGANAVAALQVVRHSGDAPDIKEAKLAALDPRLEQLKIDLIDAVFGENSYSKYVLANSVQGGLAANNTLSSADRRKFQDIDIVLRVVTP